MIHEAYSSQIAEMRTFPCVPSLSFMVMTSLFAAPTSAPLDVSVDDVNDCSLTIQWTTPETVGESGLNGYAVEYCKDGSKSVCVCCVAAPVPRVSEGRQIHCWV